MDINMIITVSVVILAFVLFATEYFSVDHVALTIIAVLVITGVLEADDAVKGFANPATITVAAMFVLSDALIKTGLLENIGPLFLKLLSKSYHATLLIMISAVGVISAFVNNTPVVATLIPVISDASQKNKVSASKLLIPLSYGAMIGGCCTLIGTSTNLLLNGIVIENGMDSLGMFAMAPLGLVFFLVGTVYLLLFSGKLLPEKRNQLKDADFNVKTYLTEVEIIEPADEEDSDDDDPLLLSNLFEKDGLEVSVKRIKRGDSIQNNPENHFKLQPGDKLLISGEREKIQKLLKNESVLISENMGSRTFENEQTRLVEIVVLPNSNLVRQKLDNLDFLHRYRAKVLAIRQRGQERLAELQKVRLKKGDIVLLQTNELGYAMLRRAQQSKPAPFVMLSETSMGQFSKWRLGIVIAVIAIVIALAALNITSIMVAAIAAVSVLIFANITSMEDAYAAIDWQVIILLGGALSLGEAMDQSGVSELVASFLVTNIGEKLGPIAVVSALYFTTSLLTEIMSNNAAAALLGPVALSIAAGFGLSPIPFIMAIAFAASASFMTPIGYQTNTMVYSAGNYAFRDFVKIGAPLNVLFWIIATILIPIIYPF